MLIKIGLGYQSPSESIPLARSTLNTLMPSYKTHSSPKNSNQFKCLQTTERIECACHTHGFPMNCWLFTETSHSLDSGLIKKELKKKIKFSNRLSPLLALPLFLKGFDSTEEQYRLSTNRNKCQSQQTPSLHAW